MTREEAKQYIIQHCNPDYPNGNTEWETAMNMAISALQQPEIVRCKDCKHYKTHIDCVGGEYAGCDVCLDCGNEILCEADDYCSYAERRDNA